MRDPVVAESIDNQLGSSPRFGARTVPPRPVQLRFVAPHVPGLSAGGREVAGLGVHPDYARVAAKKPRLVRAPFRPWRLVRFRCRRRSATSLARRPGTSTAAAPRRFVRARRTRRCRRCRLSVRVCLAAPLRGSTTVPEMLVCLGSSSVGGTPSRRLWWSGVLPSLIRSCGRRFAPVHAAVSLFFPLVVSASRSTSSPWCCSARLLRADHPPPSAPADSAQVQTTAGSRMIPARAGERGSGSYASAMRAALDARDSRAGDGSDEHDRLAAAVSVG